MNTFMTYSGRIYVPIFSIPHKFIRFLNVIGVVGAGCTKTLVTSETNGRPLCYNFLFSNYELSPLLTTKRLFLRYSSCYDIQNIFQFLTPNIKIAYMTMIFKNLRVTLKLELVTPINIDFLYTKSVYFLVITQIS